MLMLPSFWPRLPKISDGSALRHFEVEWGGVLPATADSVLRYLAHYASTLSVATLHHRLAAIANWHIEQGFPDPTKAPLVKKRCVSTRASGCRPKLAIE